MGESFLGYKVDENFFQKSKNNSYNKIDDILDEDETVLLRTSPKKKAFILIRLSGCFQ